MPRRAGARFDRGLGLTPLNRPAARKPAGIYPDKSSGAGQYGSTAYPTVLEQYNRASDYKRWTLGQAYYFGTNRMWADYQIHSLARFLNAPASGGVDELDVAGSKEVTTVFPSANSPERAWYTSTRTRGSLILPVPIDPAHITLNTSDPDPANHTLVYRVSDFYTPEQIAIYFSFLGDQFEDTASGPRYPDDLVPRPVGSVALTLISVNPGSGTLVFDLSRPQQRVLRNGHIYWSAPTYNPAAPLVWDTGRSRYLCSSFKFFCCCPDCLAGDVTNLEDPPNGDGIVKTFPLPNAASSVDSAWEREGVSYYRQWRMLPDRHDERRECKHIHAMRWECGIPWIEPSDYPVGEERFWLEEAARLEAHYRSIGPGEYFRLQRVNWDRYILTLADTVGMTIFPGGDVRRGIRPSAAPMLWNDGVEPAAANCRNNDWWLPRGTQRLQIFDASTRRFKPVVTKAGRDYPVLEELRPGQPGAPVIVP